MTQSPQAPEGRGPQDDYVGQLRALAQFAYENGYHEHGHDLVSSAIKQAVSRQAATHTASPWVSVEERMPEVGVVVLFRGLRWESVEVGALTSDDHGRVDGWEVRTASDEDTAYYLSDITHWMPLPAPPPQPGPRTLAAIQAEVAAIGEAEARGRYRMVQLKREMEKMKEVTDGSID